MAIATALDTLGTQAGKRSDIVVVRRDKKVDLIEVRSPSQPDPRELITKLQEMRAALPVINRGRICLYEIDGTLIPIPEEACE